MLASTETLSLASGAFDSTATSEQAGLALPPDAAPLLAVEANASTTPQLAIGTANASNDDWTTIQLDQSFGSMVIVATVVNDAAGPPLVTRVRQTSDNQFDLRVDRADLQTGTIAAEVHYLVVEAGVYTLADHGIKMDAFLTTSSTTDHSTSWVGEDRRSSLSNSYVKPVVVGQVMTYNDPRWSTFWSRGNSRMNPANTSRLYVGKHVGQDATRTRNAETLGVVVVESGSGAFDGIPYEATLSNDSVDGVGNAAPGNSFPIGLSDARVAVASQSAMDGTDGGWAILRRPGLSATTIDLAIDEDQVFDQERAHTNEQVAYIVFGNESTSTNTAPMITSNGGQPIAMLTQAEGVTTVVDFTAFDAEGDVENDGLSYRISGGADQDAFTINSATGLLRFTSGPDFENPTDENTDNRYDVEVTVTDSGGLTDSQMILLTVSDVNEVANPRVTDDLLVLYTFEATTGTTVFDRSANGTPLDLVIEDPANVTRTEGAISIDAATRIGSNLSANKVSDAIAASGEVTVEAWILPANASQSGPARIVSLSSNIFNRNVTLGASNSRYDVRLRTTTTSLNGTPSTQSNAGSLKDQLTHVVYTRSATGASNIYLDGVLAKTQTVGGILTNWNSNYQLSLANEASLGRPWLGRYELVAMYSQALSPLEVLQNFSAGHDPTPPQTSPEITSSESALSAENETSVIDIQATDDSNSEGSGLAYAFTTNAGGGADNNAFSLNGETGLLQFLAAPNFESPTDNDVDGTYVVQVTVTDSDGETDSQDLTVQVTDQNEPPTLAGGSVTSMAVVENQTFATSLLVTDPDQPPQVLTFSIAGGDDEAAFRITPDTGVLSFDVAPDFESPADANMDNAYQVQILVTDSGVPPLTATQDVTVTILDDANEVSAPLIVSAANVDVDENTILVVDIQATDDTDSEGSGLAYSFSSDDGGGADNGLFTLDSATGLLSFLAAPDFETAADNDLDGVYLVQVTVTDSTSLTETQDLIVSVGDQNETPEIGGGPTAAFEVVENQTMAAALLATDPDQPPQALTFSIAGGDDEAAFNIAPDTGALTFSSVPNFEAPADADLDNIYQVQISVTDAGDPPLFAVQSITVTIVDDTSEVSAPLIVSAANVDVDENTILVVDIQAADDTDSEGSGLAYSFSSDDGGGADNGLFTLDSATGLLSFLAAPDFETAADNDLDGVYLVQVTVTDSTSLTATQDLIVSVGDQNETPEIGGGPTAAFEVVENQTMAAALLATDPDQPPQVLTFSIAGGDDEAAFRITPDTGVLSFDVAPDFESPADANMDNAYQVQILVTDSGVPPLTATQDVTVTILDDANEVSAPLIVSAANVDVDENTILVVDIQATDDTDSEGSGLAYSFSSDDGGGADNGLFTLDSATGLLSFLAAPDFETAADNDLDGVYLVQVTVTDSTSLTATQDLIVSVGDQNETPEIGGGPTAAFEVVENQTMAAALLATDPDQPPQALTFSIAGGDDEAAFNIAPDTGALTFSSVPNFEAPADADLDNIYQVQISVTDAGDPPLFAVQSITVTIVDDTSEAFAPRLITPSSATVVENQTEVLEIDAADDEDSEGDGLTFGLSTFNDGGVDNGQFEIDNVTGSLRFVTPPNFEAAADNDLDNVFLLQVTVTDSTGLVDTQDIVVQVTDQNEPPAILGGATSMVSAEEDQTVATTIQATDPDLPSTAVTYVISGGDDQAAFQIAPQTGVLTFSSVPNYETPTDVDLDNVYEVQITVTDSSDIPQSASQTVLVSVQGPVTPTAPIAIFDGQSTNGLYASYSTRATVPPGPGNVETEFYVEDNYLRNRAINEAALVTTDRYRDYVMVLEFKWGDETFPPRDGKAKNAGLLFHSNGKELGWNDRFTPGIESQMLDGGMGDIILLRGFDDSDTLLPMSVTANAEQLACGPRMAWNCRDGFRWNENSPPLVFDGANTNTLDHVHSSSWDNDNWQDTEGFRGSVNHESPDGDWNQMVVVADGNDATVYFNHVMVNHVTNVFPNAGRIQLESEFAEFSIRRWELLPLGTPAGPAITTAQLAKGVIGSEYARQIDVVAQQGPLSFDITVGELPAGLSLDPQTGQIAGVPTNIGTSTFSVEVTDGLGGAATSEFSIEVSEASVGNSLMQTGVITATNSAWTTITLPNVYQSPVVVTTIENDRSSPPVITRIQNADAGNSFDLRLDRVDGQNGEVTADVHFLVVEAGVYTAAEHGIKMEAFTFASSVTDRKLSWVGQNATTSLTNSYSAPVVLGQVMSYADSRWSAFWSRGSSATNPATGTNLFVGKHVGEDSQRDRIDETLGVIVIESGNGAVGDLDYYASLTSDTIDGVNNDGEAAPLGLPSPDFAIATQTGMDGGDGGWAVLFGSSPLGTEIQLAIDEDRFRDTERSHTTEQVGYLVFAVNLLPTAIDDRVATDEQTLLVGNVLINNGLGTDQDPEGASLSVVEVNALAANVGNVFDLPSGARLLVGSDGTFEYDPNGQFDSLAAGSTTVDSFSYAIQDESGRRDTATVMVTISGIDEPEALLQLALPEVSLAVRDSITVRFSTTLPFSRRLVSVVDATTPPTTARRREAIETFWNRRIDDSKRDEIVRDPLSAPAETLLDATRETDGFAAVDAVFSSLSTHA